MSSTRPSGIPIISGDQVPVGQEVSVIDERGRLNFLPRWLQGLDWHPKHASSEVDAMMVLSEPGLVGLYLWEVYGPKILECYEELAQSPGSLELEALRLIQDRYQRLKIPAKERSYLGDPALLHLGNIKRGTKSPIYVAIFPDHLELLSKECRDSRLLVGARARWFALGSLAKE